MAGKISDLLIGGDLIDQQLTEFLDPGLKTQNEIARRTSAMLTGVTPESPGAPSAQMAARLTAQGFENLRRGLAQRNPGRFANEAELFQQQVQGLDLTNPDDRAKAVAAARRINPARAMQLAQAFQAQDQAQLSQTRYPTYQNSYQDGTVIIGTSTSPEPTIIKDGQTYSLAKGTTPEQMRELTEAAVASGPAMAFDTAAATAAGNVEGGARSEQLTAVVDNATADSYALRDLRLTLRLLEEVKTGGISGALERGLENVLGTTDVTTGQLVNLLGTNVLSQLRNTFGASFTAEEGRQLQDISAGINNSPEANMGIIMNIIRKYEAKMRQALLAEKQLQVRNPFAQQLLEDAVNGTGDFEILPDEYTRDIELIVGRYLYDDLGMTPPSGGGGSPVPADPTPSADNGFSAFMNDKDPNKPL